MAWQFPRRRRCGGGVVICAFLVALAATGEQPALAGSLTPPGAPARTMRTLSEIEPRIPIGPLTTPGGANATAIITEPGVYYLTADLFGSGGKHGIQVLTSLAVIDLNGYTIWGTATALNGVNATVNTTYNLTIRNGSIRGFNGRGVNVATGETSTTPNGDAVIEDLTLVANSGGGIVASGSITRCRLIFNGENLADSIVGGGSITDCMVMQGGKAGIRALSRTVVERCQLIDNNGHGVDAQSEVIIRQCNASANGGAGFFGGDNCVVVDSIAEANAQAGYSFTDGAALLECTGAGNAVGASLRDFSRIDGGVFRQNTGAGVAARFGLVMLDASSMLNATGVSVNDGANIDRCNISFNQVYGVDSVDSNPSPAVDAGQTRINGCVVLQNNLAGIRVEDDATITDCKIANNGLLGGANNAGVLVLGDGSRIDSCHFSGNAAFAIRLHGQNSVVVRNSFMNDASYVQDLTAKNRVGAIDSDLTVLGPWDNIKH